MQKGDRVIVADLSLSLPLRQRPYFSRGNVSGTTMVSWRTFEESAIAKGCGTLSASVPDDTRPHTIVIDKCCTCDATLGLGDDFDVARGVA